MKIKLLKGLVANKQAHKTGDEIEVSDRDGQALIKSGGAVEVITMPKPAPKPRRTRKKKIED